MSEVPEAIPAERGCGSRKEGGIYAELGLGPGGRPIVDFLMDPPVPVPDGMRITPRGVQLIERPAGDGKSVWHIVDWIGEEHYPNVADFVEEVAHLGLSRRLTRNLDFSKLTAESRILTVHAKAFIENCTDYRFWECPQKLPEHAPAQLPAGECCAGVWWQDIERGEIYNPLYPRDVLRKMPSFEYFGGTRPEGLVPIYRPAFFASFPMTRLVVVKGEGAEESFAKASTTALRVDQVDR